MKILLISSVIPRDTTGGEVILYRHFSQCPELKIAIATDSTKQPDGIVVQEIFRISANAILNRLAKTRFSKWVNDFRQYFNSWYNTTEIEQYIKNNKPDRIITVAHGNLFSVAQKMAEKYDIPLVTFFHDWWPDCLNVHCWARNNLQRQFRKLYQQSKLPLCISEEMQLELGRHSNARVIYPIAQKHQILTSTNKLDRQDTFRIIYAGNLSNIYGSLIKKICHLLPSIPKIELHLFGAKPDWQDSEIQEVQKQGIYQGLVSREFLANNLKEADALLVVMSFEQQDKRRMQTSFPSKIPDYCQFGKPIIIWGPEYCSAVRWGCKYESALLVTSPNPENLVSAITQLQNDYELQNKLSNKALEMSQGMFDPETIQQQFLHNFQECHQEYNFVVN